MDVKKRKLFSLNDIWIIGAILGICISFTLIFLFPSGSEKILSIRVNGETYEEIPLSQSQSGRDIELENNGFRAVIHIENGEASFVFSDCPDKLCVNQGSISETGESVVCLPGRFSISIVSSKDSGSDNDMDAVVR